MENSSVLQLNSENNKLWPMPFGLLLFTVLLIIGFADFSKDRIFYAYGQYFGLDSPVYHLAKFVELVSSIIMALLALQGIYNLFILRNKFHARKEIRLFLILFLMSTVFGILVGLIKNVNLSYIVGDSRNAIIYFSLFAIGTINNRQLKYLKNLFIFCCGMALVKIPVGIYLHFLMWGFITWRVLLKQSAFFVPMMLISLSLFANSPKGKESGKYVWFAMLSSFGFFVVQMRGFFLGAFLGLLFLFFVALKMYKSKKVISRLFFVLFPVLFVGLFAGVVIQKNITTSFGYWDKEDISGGMEYRKKQTDMLMSNFSDNWLVGNGLGFVDITYEGYGKESPRPYLFELEYHNLLTKLGIIGSGLLVSAFFSLIIGCIRIARRASTAEHRGLIIGMTAGLIALMVSSIANPLYSSIYFHMYVVLLLLVISALRAPKLMVRPPGPYGH